MAKYRKYRRYRRKSGKWSPNIQEIGTTTIQVPSSSTFLQTFTLATNPVQADQIITQTYTVKRIEVSYYIDKDFSQFIQHIEDVAAYIMFVPQGMQVTANYNLEHPEYIMAYQFLGSPYVDNNNYTAGQQYQPKKITTRLSRKLNTGDSVILFIKGNNPSTDGTSFEFHGLIRWWTKAN